ncbi:MAG: WYL domain-containing protein [Actinomycetia bacterium]|nr:WYL domain-containing protein [Actinomycetes bacterium]
MSARKSERLMNLAIALLTTRTYLTRERLRDMVQGYHGLSEEAFGRMFERDKDELRELGVPVETGSLSTYFGDEPGYRVRRADYELPPIALTADESAVLGVAAQVWQRSGAAESTLLALAKLRAEGDDPDTERLRMPVPSVGAREAAFGPLWEATTARQAVAFRYRGAEAERTLEPWSLVSRRGAWYVLGRDRDRGEPRLFKLGRITGVPRPVGRPGAFDVPRDVDMDDLVARLQPRRPEASALVAVRGERAPGLRRRATLSGALEPELPPGFTAYLVPYATEAGLAGEVAQAGPDAFVVEPGEAAAAVREHLAGLLAHLGHVGAPNAVGHLGGGGDDGRA